MRILHWYPNYLAGDGVSMAAMSLALSQAALGVDAALACADDPGRVIAPPMDPGEAVPLLRWHPWGTIRFGGHQLRLLAPRDADRLRAFAPDVVHVHGVFVPDNAWAALFSGVPLVVTPHGGYHPVVFKKSRRLTKRVFLNVETHSLYRRVAAFHALSPSEREDIAGLVKGKPIFCIPQGPGLGTLAGRVIPPRQARGAEVTFVSVGRLDIYTKGLDLLLDAFARVHTASRRPTRLVFVGPDCAGSLAVLQARAAQLGVAHAVTFTGGVPPAEVNALVSAADVYIQLSRHEGFALSIAEALCNGLPAILSDRIGMVSYPEFGTFPHVRVVPPSPDEVTTAMGGAVDRIDELRAHALMQRGRVSSFFSWERAAVNTLAMYEQLRGLAPLQTDAALLHPIDDQVELALPGMPGGDGFAGPFHPDGISGDGYPGELVPAPGADDVQVNPHPA